MGFTHLHSLTGIQLDRCRLQGLASETVIGAALSEQKDKRHGTTGRLCTRGMAPIANTQGQSCAWRDCSAQQGGNSWQDIKHSYPNGAKDPHVTKHGLGLQVSSDQLRSLTAEVEVSNSTHQGVHPGHHPKGNQQNPLEVQGLLHGAPEGRQGTSRRPRQGNRKDAHCLGQTGPQPHVGRRGLHAKQQ